MDPNQLLNELLDTELADIRQSYGNVQSAVLSAAGVRKDNYRELQSYRNVLTYSSRALFHECPRKWLLNKMEAAANRTRETPANITFAFGHAIGAGVAEYDKSKNLSSAIFAAFLAWDVDLLAKEYDGREVYTGKSFHNVVYGLQLYANWSAEETDIDEYTVLENEATILIDFEDGTLDVSHVDTILQHRRTGKIRVKENKTTGRKSVDPAEFSNAEQTIGYAVAADIYAMRYGSEDAGQEYEVMYTIYLAKEQRWVCFYFPKNHLAKVEWVQDQFFIHETLEMYSNHDMFPRRGKSCMNWNRQCQYYEMCDMDTVKIFGKRFADLETATIPIVERLDNPSVVTTVSEVLNRQKSRVKSLLGT